MITVSKSPYCPSSSLKEYRVVRPWCILTSQMFCETKTPTRGEDGDHTLTAACKTHWLEHHPITSQQPIRRRSTSCLCGLQPLFPTSQPHFLKPWKPSECGSLELWAACSPCLKRRPNKSFAVNTHCQSLAFYTQNRAQEPLFLMFWEAESRQQKDPGPMWRKKKGRKGNKMSAPWFWTLLWNGGSRYQLKWKNKCRGREGEGQVYLQGRVGVELG